MVSKMIRRIMKEGGSKTIALPPHWLRALGLDAGDQLEVIYDSVILIKPIDEQIDIEILSRELQLFERRLKIRKVK